MKLDSEKEYDLTIKGDRIPKPYQWILLLSGKITQEHEAFADVAHWEVDKYGKIDVLYKSMRNEVYSVSMDMESAGIYFGV